MQIIKRLLIAAAIIVGILLIASGWYGYKMYTETSVMHPEKTKEIVSGIYSVKDSFVNMYIIKNGSSFIAVDSGISMGNVRKEIEGLKIDPDKVTEVLLTHTDSDHTASLKLFKNAKVYISNEEAQMVNGKTARAMFIMKNSIKAPYKTVRDGEILDFKGMKVKGIFTPGHTPGSMSYLVDDKYLFTGDTLSLKDQKAQHFNEFFNMDTATEEKSIKKLAGLTGVKYIFTGHYGYTDDFEKAMESWK
ncbi:MAG TPA: MBL fold metallo-hydrolase [Clostridia bacterium]